MSELIISPHSPIQAGEGKQSTFDLEREAAISSFFFNADIQMHSFLTYTQSAYLLHKLTPTTVLYQADEMQTVEDVIQWAQPFPCFGK